MRFIGKVFLLSWDIVRRSSYPKCLQSDDWFGVLADHFAISLLMKLSFWGTQCAAQWHYTRWHSLLCFSHSCNRCWQQLCCNRRCKIVNEVGSYLSIFGFHVTSWRHFPSSQSTVIYRLVNYFYERLICVGRSDYCTFLSVGFRDWRRNRGRRHLLSPRLIISVYLRC